MADYEKLSRQEQNAILKNHGFHWKYFSDAYEDAEEEKAGWLLLDSDGEACRVEDAFAAIEAKEKLVIAQSPDSGPILFDKALPNGREVKVGREHGWHMGYDGKAEKWYLSVYEEHRRRRVTIAEYNAAYPQQAQLANGCEIIRGHGVEVGIMQTEIPSKPEAWLWWCEGQSLVSGRGWSYGTKADAFEHIDIWLEGIGLALQDGQIVDRYANA